MINQFRSIPVALAIVGIAMGFTAHAQEIGRLYAARPPAGSAYVRFVRAEVAPVRVGIEGANVAEVLPREDAIASVYRIVDGGRAFAVTVDGKAVGTVTPAADQFTTIVLRNDGGILKAVPIADSTEGSDDLKAELRLYNLVPGCVGAVAIAAGPTVFKDVPEAESRRRAINPVEASLVGKCGAKESAPMRLPSLKAGDHYSLFLIGASEAPILAGQLDSTEPYKKPAD